MNRCSPPWAKITMHRQLTSQIINAAIEVHRQLGPGLLESVYLRCLQIELEFRSIYVQTELQLPVTYKGQVIHDLGFRMDMLVENQVVVELKSVQRIEPVHKKQLLSYLRLSDKEIGLLINFNEVLLKDGILRVANSSFTSKDVRELL
jgi:GxxExxY protein